MDRMFVFLNVGCVIKIQIAPIGQMK